MTISMYKTNEDGVPFIKGGLWAVESPQIHSFLSPPPPSRHHAAWSSFSVGVCGELCGPKNYNDLRMGIIASNSGGFLEG